MSDLEAALARVPIFAGANTMTARLAGLTNVNHLVELGEDGFVLRIPGAGTGEYINRVEEEVAARSAAAADVNAEVVFFDPTDGLMVTRFIDGAVTMSGESFGDLAAVGRAARVLRQLHTTAAPFAADFKLFAMIDEYKALLAAKGARLPDGYDDVQRQAEIVRAALEAAPGSTRAVPLRSVVRELPRHRRSHVPDRLRVRRQQRPDVGPRRLLRGGDVHRRAG